MTNLTNLPFRARILQPYLFILCLQSLGGMLFAASDPLLAQAATRPNIVVIMTDDQTVRSMRVMPKTRALIGAAGTTFRNSFASFPLCCPSRATFLTGQYAHNHGVLGNNSPAGGYTKLDHTNTLALWLRDAGYWTSHIGRYLNGYTAVEPPEVPPGWDDWQALRKSEMYDYSIYDNGVLVKYGNAPADYQTDVLADRAVETIREAALNQPFFLNVAVKAPHIEEDVRGFPNPRPAPRHLNAFSQAPLPRPPSFNEADVSDKPASIRDLPLLTATTMHKITERYRSELASLLAVDDLVRRVVGNLADTGMLANTVIIFTSDNGFLHGEHRVPILKGKVYEESARVPLLIRGKGFPRGAVAKQFVANVDLAPTIVQLARAAPRLIMDGRSLLPLARNPDLGTARDLLVESQTYKAVRNSSFLYVEHNNGERELYDMRPDTANYDPYQLSSLHANDAYRRFRTQLATKLNLLRDCSGASCGAR